MVELVNSRNRRLEELELGKMRRLDEFDLMGLMSSVHGEAQALASHPFMKQVLFKSSIML